MKTSCLRLKLVELNFLVSFNTDDQSKTDVANAVDVITNIQIQVIKMNLFNQLNHRYGQSCIEEVRSWEGKEHKLARHKCHLHFNLRCLSQNIVPKGVKLNIKQFSTFQEKKIICKTHRSILNSRVRYCNRIIKKLESHINKIKSSLKDRFNNKDFKDIVEVIYKSKEKVFKVTKNQQIKKFNHLQQQPRYRNTPVPDIIRKKWVINLSSKSLSRWRAIYSTEGP